MIQHAIRALENLDTIFDNPKAKQTHFDFIRTSVQLPHMQYSTESLKDTIEVLQYQTTYSTEAFVDYLTSDDAVSFIHYSHQLTQSIESLDDLNISTEDEEEKKSWIKKIVDFIKNLIEKMKNGFQGFISFVKNRLASLFTKVKQDRSKIDKTFDALAKTKFASDEEVKDKIIQWFDKNASATKNTNFIIDSKGELIDPISIIPRIEKEMKRVDGFWNKLKMSLVAKAVNVVMDSDNDSIYAGINEELLEEITGSKSFLEKIKTGEARRHHSGDHVLKLKVPKFLEDSKRILDNFDKADAFYRKATSDIERKLKEIQKSMKEYETFVVTGNEDHKQAYEKLRNVSTIFTTQMQLAYTPASIATGQIRLCFHLAGELSSEEYTTTTKGPDTLLHLSDNPNLPKTLTPRHGVGTNFGEFLPPRISFAPDVLACCAGIRRYFIKGNEDGQQDGLFYKDFYLYTGVPEAGKTRYVKPELMVSEFGGIQNRIKETPVTTPIDIVKTSKVRIFYKPPRHEGVMGASDNFKSDKFVRYEVLENY